MNEVKLRGVLTRDAKLRWAGSGVGIWETTIAVNGVMFDRQAGERVVTTLYVALQAFDWQAEKLASWTLMRGEEVVVYGELDQREVEKEDGSKESKTRVTVWYVVPTRRKTQI